MNDLLQLMYQDGHLSSTELTALKRTVRQLGENPVRVLRSLNVVTPVEIKTLLQRYFGFPAATDQLIEELDDSLRASIPADLALHYCVLPIAEEDNQIFTLMEDPTDKGTIQQLEFFLAKKIVPVIATAQQLSKGLCRLYGVEPGRLNLSGLLETSRGAVGAATLMQQSQPQLVDDSEPLLDDEAFRKLKVKRQPEQTTRKQSEVSSERQSKDTAMPMNDPALAAALNLLGLRLSLSPSRPTAINMANEALSAFRFRFELVDEMILRASLESQTYEVNLNSPQTMAGVPLPLQRLLKKIAQCPKG